VIADPGTKLSRTLRPLSVELARAANATLYDSKAIASALSVIHAAAEQLRYHMEEPTNPAHEELEWERTPALAQCSSLIEGAGGLLALAYSPNTPERLRGLFVRRAYWVLSVAAEKTAALLAQDGR
jgi:hypothetical protein